MTEYLDIVNDDNQVVGQATKEEVYQQKLNHRIVHIFVVHPRTGEVYLQKRAEDKSFLPGYYCTSAGGHVHAGESYKQAAKRELYEELGLQTRIHPGASLLFISDGHKRFIEVFITYAAEGFDFIDGEVASTAWRK